MIDNELLLKIYFRTNDIPRDFAICCNPNSRKNCMIMHRKTKSSNSVAFVNAYQWHFPS